MTTPLLKLTKEEIHSINLLYLAPYAPDKDAKEPPEMHPEFGVAPRYNYEIYQVLLEMGFKVTPCRDLSVFLKTIKKYNYIFTLFNWALFRNPEVFVSSICEYYHVPYLGAPPNIRALAEDKRFSKNIAADLGIPTTPGAVVSCQDDLSTVPGFRGPYFVKPRFGSASKGINIDCAQTEWQELQTKIVELYNANGECLIEQCVSGTDITVPVLGGDPPIIFTAIEEISVLPFGIATHRQKRLIDKGRKRIIFNDQSLINTLNKHVNTLALLVKPFDYLRVDFRLNQDRDALFLLEFNLGCNLGSHAAMMMSGEHRGYSQQAIINHIIAHSIRRQKT